MFLQFGSESRNLLLKNDVLSRFAQDFGMGFCNVAVADVLSDVHHGLQKEMISLDEELLYCFSRYKLMKNPISYRNFGIDPDDKCYIDRVSEAEEKGFDVDREWFCLIAFQVHQGVQQFPEEFQRMILNHPRYDHKSDFPGLVIPSFLGCFATTQILARFWDEIASRFWGSGKHAAGGKRFTSRNAPKLNCDQEALVRESAEEAFENMIISQFREAVYKVSFDQEHSDLVGTERGVLRVANQNDVGDVVSWLEKRGLAKRSIEIQDISGRFISIRFDDKLKSDAWRIVSEETDSLRIVSGLDEIQEIVDSI